MASSAIDGGRSGANQLDCLPRAFALAPHPASDSAGASVSALPGLSTLGRRLSPAKKDSEGYEQWGDEHLGPRHATEVFQFREASAPPPHRQEAKLISPCCTYSSRRSDMVFAPMKPGELQYAGRASAHGSLPASHIGGLVGAGGQAFIVPAEERRGVLDPSTKATIFCGGSEQANPVASASTPNMMHNGHTPSSNGVVLSRPAGYGTPWQQHPGVGTLPPAMQQMTPTQQAFRALHRQAQDPQPGAIGVGGSRPLQHIPEAATGLPALQKQDVSMRVCYRESSTCRRRCPRPHIRHPPAARSQS